MLLRSTLLLKPSDRSFHLVTNILTIGPLSPAAICLKSRFPFVSAAFACYGSFPANISLYHLARALMHLNQLATFLPSFEANHDWDPGSSIPRPNPHFPGTHVSRNLHRFVPLPADTRPPPSMSSHGELPSHFVINPESHFHPIIHREFHPNPCNPNRGNSYEEITLNPPSHMVEDLTHSHASAHPTPRAKQASRSTAPRSITPTNEPAPARSSKRPRSVNMVEQLNISTATALLPVTQAGRIPYRHIQFHMALPVLLHHFWTLNPTIPNRTGNEPHHLLPPFRDTSLPLILLAPCPHIPIQIHLIQPSLIIEIAHGHQPMIKPSSGGRWIQNPVLPGKPSPLG